MTVAVIIREGSTSATPVTKAGARRPMPCQKPCDAPCNAEPGSKLGKPGRGQATTRPRSPGVPRSVARVRRSPSGPSLGDFGELTMQVSFDFALVPEAQWFCVRNDSKGSYGGQQEYVAQPQQYDRGFRVGDARQNLCVARRQEQGQGEGHQTRTS